MPSIGSAPRQIPTELKFYIPSQQPTQPLSQGYRYCYFEPAPSNYVGNYAPGTFECYTGITNGYISDINSNTAPYDFNGRALFRNMGKTIKADAAGIDKVYNGQNVQLLAATGDVNSPTYNTSGVFGGPNEPNFTSKSGYYNLYIGIPIQGQGRLSTDIFPSA